MAVKCKLGYLDFLEQASKEKATACAQRMRWLPARLAGLQSIKMLDEFDFDFDLEFALGLRAAFALKLGGLSFLERVENVVLLGPGSVGKTILLWRLDSVPRRPVNQPSRSNDTTDVGVAL
jgi:DNA replication protein DnaC